METYHQEIGRAGRDGDPAECVIFWRSDDYGTWQERFYVEDGRTAITDHKIELAAAMNDYCLAPHCRHALLVEYFQPPRKAPVSDVTCNACDICGQ